MYTIKTHAWLLKTLMGSLVIPPITYTYTVRSTDYSIPTDYRVNSDSAAVRKHAHTAGFRDSVSKLKHKQLFAKLVGFLSSRNVRLIFREQVREFATVRLGYYTN